MQLQNDQGKRNYKLYLFIYLFQLYYRGFGFITFKEANSVDNVLAKEIHMLDDKQV